MANLVPITDAANEVPYSVNHIRTLLLKRAIQGRKAGGIWLVDLDDLKEYQKKMEELGKKKFTTNKNKAESSSD